MSRTGIVLSRALALVALLGVAACMEQRDLGAISGMPDAQFGNRDRNRVWGTMTTGGQAIVVHREVQ